MPQRLADVAALGRATRRYRGPAVGFDRGLRLDGRDGQAVAVRVEIDHDRVALVVAAEQQVSASRSSIMFWMTRRSGRAP